MLKRVFVIFALSSVVFLVGCASLSKPRVPKTLDHYSTKILYSEEQLAKDKAAYEIAIGNAIRSASNAAGRFDEAKTIRDSVIYKIKADIDAYYYEYEILFNNRRAGADIAGDILELSLSAATTITNGERAKTVLASILSFVQGSRLSINENYFREKTTAAIISQMRANRTRVKNDIIKKLSDLNPVQYSLNEALGELTDYFYEGTIIAGIIGLTNEAGSSAAEAKKDTEKINEDRVKLDLVSSQDRTSVRLIRLKFNQLRRDKDVAAAKEALKVLNQAAPEGMTDEDVFKRLQQAIEDTTDINLLKKALKVTPKTE